MLRRLIYCTVVVPWTLLIMVLFPLFILLIIPIGVVKYIISGESGYTLDDGIDFVFEKALYVPDKILKHK